VNSVTVFVIMALGIVGWELGKDFANWCFDRRHGGGK